MRRPNARRAAVILSIAAASIAAPFAISAVAAWSAPPLPTNFHRQQPPGTEPGPSTPGTAPAPTPSPTAPDPSTPPGSTPGTTVPIPGDPGDPGGPGDPGAPGQPPSEEHREAMKAFAECMKEQGVNVPPGRPGPHHGGPGRQGPKKPEKAQGGSGTAGDGSGYGVDEVVPEGETDHRTGPPVDEEKLKAAWEACKDKLPPLPPISEEQLAKIRAWEACMKENGVEVPPFDPTTRPNPFDRPEPPAVDPEVLQAAREACKDLQPFPGQGGPGHGGPGHGGPGHGGPGHGGPGHGGPGGGCLPPPGEDPANPGDPSAPAEPEATPSGISV